MNKNQKKRRFINNEDKATNYGEYKLKSEVVPRKKNESAIKIDESTDKNLKKNDKTYHLPIMKAKPPITESQRIQLGNRT